ncbi:quinone-dependent dihydroorotate dehydrogenase [Woodsholea maritima]|uniref:quinone-dependent dihydroorotate dehydrogenase n=1 Tax=Woodsholea maritima TaxID=240237 RepID=UPI0003611513|nr:quinone-dependent dihydroorotate dehydrogenase [Woodsholea maritima]
MSLHDTMTRFMHVFPAETAHGLALTGLKMGFGPQVPALNAPELKTHFAGLALDHPVGLAAGFDKNGEAPDALLNCGFAFVELGAVTPRPQAGNPKPRVFRLSADKAVINRMGFNNQGVEALARRLEARKGKPGVVGINLGANKDSADRIADYVALLETLSGLASFFTVNISSPNTPGLRGLQDEASLHALLEKVNDARGAEPVFLKIAPDLDDSAIEPILEAVRAHNLSGLVVSNTTLARPESLKDAQASEAGGLSGAPLFEPSTALLKAFRRAAGPALPIMGVGGISSAETAFTKIKAGANVVQFYSAMVYEGPGLVQRVRDGLLDLVKAEGYASIADAVGVEAGA